MAPRTRYPMRIAVAFLLLLVPACFATVVRPPAFPDLVAKADAVIRGEVTAVRVELRNHAGRELPFTVVEIAVERTITGTAPARLELILLGGTTGDRTLEVVGQPQFVVGDRDVLFVQGNGRQFSPLVAMAHGRYLIVEDRHRGEVVARNNGEPLAAVADVARPLDAHQPGPRNLAMGGMSLAAFEAEIIAAARARASLTPAR